MDEDSFKLKEKQKTELNKEFYEKQIESLKIQLKCLEMEGIDALHPIDHHLGLETAKLKLKEQIIYFEEKLR